MRKKLQRFLIGVPFFAADFAQMSADQERDGPRINAKSANL